jgi:hypothetical protein
VRGPAAPRPRLTRPLSCPHPPPQRYPQYSVTEVGARELRKVMRTEDEGAEEPASPQPPSPSPQPPPGGAPGMYPQPSA